MESKYVVISIDDVIKEVCSMPVADEAIKLFNAVLKHKSIPAQQLWDVALYEMSERYKYAWNGREDRHMNFYCPFRGLKPSPLGEDFSSIFCKV